MSQLVVLSPGCMQEFSQRCTDEYELAEQQVRPPRQWAILTGRMFDKGAHVMGLHYGRNIRETGDTISTRFGGVYRDVRRGFWCDAQDILVVMNKVRKLGQEVLGSIHFHADLYNKLNYSAEMLAAEPEFQERRRDPALPADDERRSGDERRRRPRVPEGRVQISVQASHMDHNLFRATGWPLNMIYYLERQEGALIEAMSAWHPGEGEADDYQPGEIVREELQERRSLHVAG